MNLNNRIPRDKMKYSKEKQKGAKKNYVKVDKRRKRTNEENQTWQALWVGYPSLTRGLNYATINRAGLIGH